MKKVLVYGSVALAVFGLGAWVGSRQKKAQLLSGPYDYIVVVPTMLTKANKQIAKALFGTWLTSARSAEDNASFWSPSATNAEAYAKASYWMAVAARIAKSRTLAAEAGLLAEKGVATYAMPTSSFWTADVASILTSAAARITATAQGNKEVLAVARILSTHAVPNMIASAKQTAAGRSVVANTVAKTAQDVVDGGKAITTGLGLSWWTKLGIGAAVLLGLGIVFRAPLTAASQTVQRLLGSTGPRSEQKALPAPKET